MVSSRRSGKLMTMSGFKNFIMRGNLVELAVAVVIGTQFSNLVKQFVSSFVNPLLSLIGGTPSFGNLSFKVGKATFTYGAEGGQVPGAAAGDQAGWLVMRLLVWLRVGRRAGYSAGRRASRAVTRSATSPAKERPRACGSSARSTADGWMVLTTRPRHCPNSASSTFP